MERPFGASESTAGEHRDDSFEEHAKGETGESVMPGVSDHARSSAAAIMCEYAEHHAVHRDEQHASPAFITVRESESDCAEAHAEPWIAG